MKRAIWGTLCGGIVFYLWGMSSWMLIPWHNNVVHVLPEEQLITDTLKTVITEPGLYMYPGMTRNGAQVDRQTFADRYQKGPTGMVIFSPGGKSCMPPATILIGLLTTFAVAALTMVLLGLTRDRVKTLLHRAGVVTLVGAVVALAAHVAYWNWMGFPGDFSLIAVLDSLIGFFLLGLSQSPFVRND